MPAPAPYFSVSDTDVQVGDHMIDLIQGPTDRVEEAPIVLLRRRMRALEIRVLALEVNRPSARWQRYVTRWRTRLRKAHHWISRHAADLRAWRWR